VTAGAVIAERADFAPTNRARRPLRGMLASLARFAVGAVLCLTPATAILVLGWLMRLMQREEHYARQRLQGAVADEPGPRLPDWIMGETPTSAGPLTRWLGSLVDNLRQGLAAFVTLAVGTLPFTLLWLFGWWGGWENSFNKGYEQAWVGRTIGLLGVAISLPLLARLPMAVAHQAAEGRMGAFFAFRDVHKLIRLAGWRYVGLSLLFVLAALPLFLAKAAPVFVEQWNPGFTDRNAAEIEAFGRGYRLWATVYVLAALVLLRRASARLHARATLALTGASASASFLSSIGAIARSVLLGIVWFALVAQIFVGQFLNHAWIAWLNPPFIGLPWLPPLGAML
jgi:hypothetical protein